MTFLESNQNAKEFVKDKLGLEESSLSRLFQHMENHSCGTITAFRSDETKKVNEANHKELKGILIRRGYRVTSVKGSYIENYGSSDAVEVKEPVFFVVNPIEGNDNDKLKDDLIDLGRHYDQDSVLIIPFEQDAYLYGTSKRDNAFPSYNDSVVFAKRTAGMEKEFMTKVQGRPLSFVEKIQEETAPKNYHGRMAWASQSDRLIKEIFTN